MYRRANEYIIPRTVKLSIRHKSFVVNAEKTQVNFKKKIVDRECMLNVWNTNRKMKTVVLNAITPIQNHEANKTGLILMAIQQVSYNQTNCC
jgi:hypothetical protein